MNEKKDERTSDQFEKLATAGEKSALYNTIIFSNSH
jgi:hypothetical protein